MKKIWSQFLKWFRPSPEVKITQPQPEPSQDRRSTPEDSRKPSEKVLEDIFKGYNPSVIKDELKNLESTTNRFQKYKEELVRELKKVASRKRPTP